MADPLDFIFDVDLSTHDHLKHGILTVVRTRVVVSDLEFPTPALAGDTAACLAVAVHGGMPTRIRRIQ